jgi:hypothetical protein
MPLTKAKTDILDLNKDTTINTIKIGLGGGQVADNTGIGFNALQSNTTGTGNTAVGFGAFSDNTQGVSNTAVGSNAMLANTTGNTNTAIGAQTLAQNLIGSENTAVGYAALLTNTGNRNTSIGYSALIQNSTANGNTAVGYGALSENTTGSINVAVGFSALIANTSGGSNTAIGESALSNNITGTANTAVGASALGQTTGGSNTGIGRSALSANTTGTSNTAIGMQALLNNTTGVGNTAIGDLALGSNVLFSNVTGLGANSQVSGSNQIRIGNSSVTSVTSQTNAWSDGRDKADIRDTVLGLNFINELRPVDYKWDYREDYRTSPPETVIKPLEPKENASDEEKEKYAEKFAAYEAYVVVRDKWLEDSKLKNITHDGTHKRTRFHHGLIAQEIKAVIEKTGVDFGGFQDHTIDGGDEVMTVGYNELIGPMIKAIQELSSEVASLKAQLNP